MRRSRLIKLSNCAGLPGDEKIALQAHKVLRIGMTRSRFPGAEHDIAAKTVGVTTRRNNAGYIARPNVEVRSNLVLEVPLDDHIARAGVTRGSGTLLLDERVESQYRWQWLGSHLARRLARRRCCPVFLEVRRGRLAPRAASQG